MTSASVSRLQAALKTEFKGKVVRVSPDGHYSPNWNDDLIINWGNSSFPKWANTEIFINYPHEVSILLINYFVLEN